LQEDDENALPGTEEVQMPVRRGVASFVALLSIIAAFAVGAPSASASLDTVTGGQSNLFVPISNVSKFAQKDIFVSPIPPARLRFTLPAPSVMFPINGGAVESKTMLGTVNHAGGLLIQKFSPDGETEVNRLEVTDPKIVAGASLVGNALGLVPAPTALLVNTSHSKDKATGVIHFEADAQIDPATALVLNTYFSTDAFEPNMILGRLKSDIQTKPLLGL
jgi:hypothetical protein